MPGCTGSVTPSTSPIKLRWRATAVRHCFHVIPGENILELGAGSGLWTEHLSAVLRHENRILATVFNADLAAAASKKNLPNVRFELIDDLGQLPAGSFDDVVGNSVLSHNEYSRNLRVVHRLLKPGGQILFFEANWRNPQVAVKNLFPSLGRMLGNASCQIGLRKYELMRLASQQGFIDIDITPYDIIHPRTPRFAISALQSSAYILEHAPVIKELCGTLYIRGSKPPDRDVKRKLVNLASDPELFDSTSFVIPCYNEEMNIPRLVQTIVGLYGPYVHEIVIVNDNSSDGTGDVARAMARIEPRVKCIDRKPPGGVGRALREGYAAATGRYILSMDCDFAEILPGFAICSTPWRGDAMARSEAVSRMIPC